MRIWGQSFNYCDQKSRDDLEIMSQSTVIKKIFSCPEFCTSVLW